MNRLLLACACLLLSPIASIAADSASCPSALPSDADLGRCADQALMAKTGLYVTTSGRMRALATPRRAPSARPASSIAYEVQVVGEDGKPVPFATLWEVVSYHRSPRDVDALMKRLVSRYADDVEIVESAQLTTALLVRHADHDGRATLFADAKAREDIASGALPVAIGALKRGWQPAVQSMRDELDTTHSLTLRLAPRAGFIDDDALAELDEIRGAVLSTADSLALSDRSRVMAAATDRVRRLAEQAVEADKSDIAATLFQAQAAMPSVDLFVDTAGRARGMRIVNGYDDRDPARVAAHRRALALNASNPQMLFERMRATYVDDPKLPRSLMIGEARRRALLADEMALHDRFGARLWPIDDVEEWRLMALLGQYAAACARLKDFRRFEPTFETDDEWRQAAVWIAVSAKNRGDASSCDVDAPAPP